MKNFGRILMMLIFLSTVTMSGFAQVKNPGHSKEKAHKAKVKKKAAKVKHAKARKRENRRRRQRWPWCR